MSSYREFLSGEHLNRRNIFEKMIGMKVNLIVPIRPIKVIAIIGNLLVYPMGLSEAPWDTPFFYLKFMTIYLYALTNSNVCK